MRHRKTLVAALAACACGGEKPRARRFLLGLSNDELQFIAEFLGACILECSQDVSLVSQAIEAHAACEAPGKRSDREHKVILLREFLHLTGGTASRAAAG